MLLNVRVTPGARVESIDRIEAAPAEGVLLHARAREGAANAALVVLLAKALGVPLLSGGRSRLKRLDVAGGAAALAGRLAALAPPKEWQT